MSELRALAAAEGRQSQALVEEAIAKLIENRRQGGARPHVMAVYQPGHARFAALYEKLAK